jgi:hypothetical protein
MTAATKRRFDDYKTDLGVSCNGRLFRSEGVPSENQVLQAVKIEPNSETTIGSPFHTDAHGHFKFSAPEINEIALKVYEPDEGQSYKDFWFIREAGIKLRNIQIMKELVKM